MDKLKRKKRRRAEADLPRQRIRRPPAAAARVGTGASSKLGRGRLSFASKRAGLLPGTVRPSAERGGGRNVRGMKKSGQRFTDAFEKISFSFSNALRRKSEQLPAGETGRRSRHALRKKKNRVPGFAPHAEKPCVSLFSLSLSLSRILSLSLRRGITVRCSQPCGSVGQPLVSSRWATNSCTVTPAATAAASFKR